MPEEGVGWKGGGCRGWGGGGGAHESCEEGALGAFTAPSRAAIEGARAALEGALGFAI